MPKNWYLTYDLKRKLRIKWSLPKKKIHKREYDLGARGEFLWEERLLNLGLKKISKAQMSGQTRLRNNYLIRKKDTIDTMSLSCIWVGAQAIRLDHANFVEREWVQTDEGHIYM